MSYEDARKELLSIAGEYKAKTSLYKLEDTTCHAVMREIKGNTRELISSFFCAYNRPR